MFLTKEDGVLTLPLLPTVFAGVPITLSKWLFPEFLSLLLKWASFTACFWLRFLHRSLHSLISELCPLETHRQQWMFIAVISGLIHPYFSFQKRFKIAPHYVVFFGHPQGTVNGRWFIIEAQNSPTALNVHQGTRKSCRTMAVLVWTYCRNTKCGLVESITLEWN